MVDEVVVDPVGKSIVGDVDFVPFAVADDVAEELLFHEKPEVVL